MNNRISNKNFQQNKDHKHLSHLMGLGLDCTDGHKRITQGDKFSILGGSDKTHDNMTETLCKTFEDLSKKGKTLEEASMEEISELIIKHTPS